MRILNPKFKFVRVGMLKNLGLVFICLWSFFVMVGYMIPLLSIATYTTLGVGLSQAEGASVQAILAAGQLSEFMVFWVISYHFTFILVGRPGLGLILDAWGMSKLSQRSCINLISLKGRINMASIITFLSGVTCFCIWMFAKNYGLLIFFALANVRTNLVHIRASHAYMHLGYLEWDLLLSFGTTSFGGCRTQRLLRLARNHMDHHSSSNTGRRAHCIRIKHVLR